MANSYNSTHTGQEIDEAVAKSLALIIDQVFNTSSTNPIANKPVAEALTAVGELLSRCITNPMTAQGDVIVGGVDGSPTRLAKGTAGQIFTMDENGISPEWKTPSASGMTNPMTTAGDIIYGGSGGEPERLGIGLIGRILRSNGSSPEWVVLSVGYQDMNSEIGANNAPSGQVPMADGDGLVGWSYIYASSIKAPYASSGDLLAANGSGGTAFTSLTSLLTSIPGYDATKTQVLANNQGTLAWEEATSGSGLDTRVNSLPNFNAEVST